MPRRITPQNVLDNVKREAKRWLKALRANDANARARLERALAAAPAPAVLTLRDIQHALARERGFVGWTALTAHLRADSEIPESLIWQFLDNACPDHHVRGGPDHLRARHTAMRLLERHPGLARANFFTNVVCGDVDAVERDLSADPSLAAIRGVPASPERSGGGDAGDLMRRDFGPKGWDALLYLCFTRLPLPAANENADAIARTLLTHGADPNIFFMAGGSRYTPLVGVVGEGEEARPPHPQRDRLVRLLFERGAEPYDIQVAYNIHFQGRVLWFLRLVYEWSIRRGRSSDWRDSDWPMLGMGNYGSGARWYLDLAVQHDDLELAGWCLAHGANPNAPPARSVHLPRGSLYEEAIRRGTDAMADLLVRYGAVRTIASPGIGGTVGRLLRLEWPELMERLAKEPALVRTPELLVEAVRRDRGDVVEVLLDRGASPEVENARKERPLHHAVYANSLKAAKVLLQRGADADVVETEWGNTPLGAALYGQQRAMIELLAPYSHNVWDLTFSGNFDRLRAVLEERPERARISTQNQTPLMWLPPQDERIAMEIARLWLAYGIDPAVRNSDGMTAADRAERLEMLDVAALLRAAAGSPNRGRLARYEQTAANLLEAYRTGTPEAMQRHWADTWHRRSWEGMRRYVELDLGREPESSERPGEGFRAGDITIDDARWLVAREHRFPDWSALRDHVLATVESADTLAAAPLRVGTADGSNDRTRRETRDWNEAIDRLRQGTATSLDASGQMTDEMLRRIAGAEQITSLRLDGSSAVTDEGLRALAGLPHLRELDISRCSIGDSGIEVLRELPALRSINLAMTNVTDRGVAVLSECDQLERVDLSMTATGDGAVRALVDKAALRHFKSGTGVTDSALALLHQFPVFKVWRGGESKIALLSPEAEPNSLSLRGQLTDRGLAHLAGLEGLFALNLDDRRFSFTVNGLSVLTTLPNLGWLAIDATDETMPIVAAIPRLRMILCQDTPAGDEGFVALSRSPSIEYIWARHSHNVRDRGFAALAAMPALRGLSVSCRHVGRQGLAALPHFPALRELMPIDVTDEGFEEVGRCATLESLVLMYCRGTTDAATERIMRLPRLEHYFASYTRITDRTPEILAGIASLRRIELTGCARVTDDGIAALARLPHLESLQLSGMQRVTREVELAFDPSVAVIFSP